MLGGLALGVVPLWGCPAEQLGVDVPRGGPDAISQEDLQRDVFLFEDPEFKGQRGPGNQGAALAALRLQDRLQQMHLLPAFGDGYSLPVEGGGAVVCGRKDGKGDQGVVLIALDLGSGARGGALPYAAAISLAKAFDVPQQPAQTVVICGAPAVGGLEAYAANPALQASSTKALFVVGPLDDKASAEAAGAAMGAIPTRRVTMTGALPPEDRADDLDYRDVVVQVKALHGLLVGAF